MGMDLVGAGGYFRWSIFAWPEVLELGQEFGWEPIGTGPYKGQRKADCTGYYAGNDGQLFYARDAKRLADALERVLASLPVEEPPKPGKTKTGGRGGKPKPQYFQFGPEVGDLSTRSLQDFLDFASGRKKRRRGSRKDRYLTPSQATDIREFIEFCRAGSFRIY